MNVLDAAHRTAHEYGVEEMALRLGVGYKVFNSQVNPNDPGHILGLVNAVRMQQIAGRYEILYSMAEALGHVCILRPDVDCGDDVNEAVSRTCVEFGEFLHSVTDALRDKKVTRNEAKRMQKELAEMITSATTLHSVVSSMAEARAPK